MDKKDQLDLIARLAEICQQLDWVIGLPDDEETLPGLIIGQEAFVSDVIRLYYGKSYEIYTQPLEDSSLKEIEPSDLSKKKDRRYH